ncbi:MAG: GDP-mannose 4,6-dehydratase [Candidatus Heimdallarchaeaceae archaeon]
MRILVTGCAGFIGSHLVEKLVQKNHSVVGIDNFDPFYSKKAKLKNIELLKSFHKNFDFTQADINDDDTLKLIFLHNNFDKVIHIAARAGVRTSLEIPISFLETNILSTVKLLELCKEFEIKDFLFASSSSVYGNTDTIPLHEGLRSDTPLNPYAASKRSAELFCYTYSYLYNINITILRFFTVYGPRQRPEMAIAKFTRLIDKSKEITIFGDGNTSRDYTYIDDIVNGILLSLKKKFSYEIFNLGSNTRVKLKEVIELIEQELNKKAKIRYIEKNKADVDNTLADISKSREILGYKPDINIKEGIRKYIKWYEENKDYYNPI